MGTEGGCNEFMKTKKKNTRKQIDKLIKKKSRERENGTFQPFRFVFEIGYIVWVHVPLTPRLFSVLIIR